MDILYFASAKPAKARRALTALQLRFPDASIAIAMCPEFEEVLQAGERERVVFRAGAGKARLRFVWNGRKRRYDWVAAVWGGDREYHTMKLAAFLLRPQNALLCFNENGDAFEWRWRNWNTVLRHIQWRLKSRTTSGSWLTVAWELGLRTLQLSFGEPVGMLILLVRTCILLIGCLTARLSVGVRSQEHA